MIDLVDHVVGVTDAAVAAVLATCGQRHTIAVVIDPVGGRHVDQTAD
ncbi:MAG TPA: hypothetical protein VFH23_17110 [Jiangellaceae bacterium]|nr:hypothetical protein [Jiangellaceae bacterium]